MEYLEQQLAKNPSLRERMAAQEELTRSFLNKQAAGQRSAATVITIPVVVHVVYNTTAENVSDTQIQSQIDVLNEDFRKLNADVSNVPSLFASLAADVEIQFCLAGTDLNGNATTGITRTQTSVTSFSDDDAVKRTSQGGRNAWPSESYLNLWVCDLTEDLLGYAQFPNGGAAATDGVVVDYAYFGRGGSALSPYDLGRTATHEVGHWLNLRHIWGDANCGNDLVDDTPTQRQYNLGCPTFPQSTCQNTSDMFMNYMDYTNDACMYMFTAGQVARMRALFETGGARASLLTSTGCGTPNNGGCNSPADVAASNLTSTGATLSWGAITGAVSYNVRYRVTGTSTWTTQSVTGTSVTLSGLSNGASYEVQVQTVCSQNSSSYAASVNFTVGVAYCSVSGGTNDEFIQRVAIGSIANTSGNNGGYANFASQSTNINAGSSASFTLTPGFTGSSYREVWRIWVDLNADGDFSDANELRYTSGRSSAAVTGSLSIPSGTSSGSKRMRIAMQYNAALSSPCGTFTYGEVEDYTINVNGVASRAIDGALAQDEAASIEFGPNPSPGTAHLHFQAAAATDVEVQVLDSRGRTVLRRSLQDVREGDLDLALTRPAPGIYFVITTIGGQRDVRKWVVTP